MPKKNIHAHLGIDWQAMPIGKHLYRGSTKGAKANACRASKLYKPKKFITFSKGKEVFVERLS